MQKLVPPRLKAIGIIAGMIIGSGMFALPYAVRVSGVFAAAIASLLAFLLVLFTHLAYGEIIINTEGRHRLPGYAKLYLGKWAGNASKLSQFFGFNTTLLIYGIFGGVFLSIVFGGDARAWSAVFFILGSIILFFRSIDDIGFINFVFSIPLFIMVLFISALAFRSGNVFNLLTPGIDPFFSFGVFVFALGGLSAMADARDVFKTSEEERTFRPAIVLGTFLPYVLYLIFVAAVLMAAGSMVSQDAISSLAGLLGNKIVKLGALVGFIAVADSYLVLAYDLKKIYELDTGLSSVSAWFLSFIVPLAFFFMNLADLIKLASIAGGLFLSADGIFVIFILRSLRASGKVSGEKEQIRFLPFGFWQQCFLFSVSALSIVYEIVYQIL